MTKKIGLLGLGKWGEVYLKNITLHPHLECAMVCTTRPSEKAKSASIPWTNQPDELFSNPSLDGFILACPPQTQEQLIIKALEKKKPVLAEKPLALSSKKTTKIIQIQKKNQTKLLVDYIHLYQPSFQKLVEILQNKNEGIQKIVLRGGNEGPIRNFDPAWDYGPHDFSILYHILQVLKQELDFESFKTKTLRTKNDFQKNYSVHAHTKQNVEIDIEFGNHFSKKSRLTEIHFLDYILRLDDTLSEQKLSTVLKNGDSESVSYSAASAMTVLLDTFYECLLNSEMVAQKNSDHMHLWISKCIELSLK